MASVFDATEAQRSAFIGARLDGHHPAAEDGATVQRCLACGARLGRSTQSNDLIHIPVGEEIDSLGRWITDNGTAAIDITVIRRCYLKLLEENSGSVSAKQIANAICEDDLESVAKLVDQEDPVGTSLRVVSTLLEMSALWGVMRCSGSGEDVTIVEWHV